jgi:hypothetical protein
LAVLSEAYQSLRQEDGNMTKDQARSVVNDFLDKNKWLQGMSVDFVASNVHIFVPVAAAALSESELRLTIAVWQSLHGAILPATPPSAPPSTQLPASPDSKLVDAVKKAITTVTDGVDIKHNNGKINLGVGGATAELKKGNSKVSAGISWAGTLSVETEKADFHFSGELSSTRWEIKLSYPEDDAVPNLTTLGDLFGKGEKAMQNIVSAVGSFKDLNDINAIKNAISPNIQPVKDAVEAVQGIAKASPKKRWNVGISVGSPDPNQVPGTPPPSNIPPGVEVKATLTLFF